MRPEFDTKLDETGNWKEINSGFIYSPDDQYLGIELIHEMPDITVDDVDQVYFGKEGCACGCNGNYHQSERYRKTISQDYASYTHANERMITRAINYMKKHAAEGIGRQDNYILTIPTSPLRHISIYLREDKFKIERKR